ncbi:MAG TPA: sodium:proton antiporter [Kofleriaceae bacterium]|nr:sodium:proton antiporter [Kofleriaceae bacterium]
MQVDLANPSLTVALAMIGGVVAQALARHLRAPGIVVLLLAGVLLGPDVAGVVRPSTLGPALPALIGFAVAIILFEGGMNLNIRLLLSQAKAIRRLITLGSFISAIGGAICARLFMGWEWRMSILFGTLVMVTGPTVITPLLRRIKVREQLETVLEAEGIFVDAIGATVAVVALSVALAPSRESFGEGLVNIFLRLGAGTVIGICAGLLLAGMLALKRLKLVPSGLENIFTLAVAVAAYQCSSAFLPESGIAAAIAAGMVLGNFGQKNMNTRMFDNLREMKEQLSVFFIGMLFVLLAADVRLAEVASLGVAGILTVISLMVIVRPACVLISTANTKLDSRDKAFMCWLGPRGIVAAAVASLFAAELTDAGIAGGNEMRALVFLVIAVTVTIQGLGGGLVARLLGVKRPQRVGYLFLGANPLAHILGRALRSAGETVTFLDANADAVRTVKEDGFVAHTANGLEDEVLAKTHAESRAGCVGLTPNGHVNFLFTRSVDDQFRGPDLYLAMDSRAASVTEAQVETIGAQVLFGGAKNLAAWAALAERGDILLQKWTYTSPHRDEGQDIRRAPGDALLPLIVVKQDNPVIITTTARPKKNDVVDFAIANEHQDIARAWLESAGWSRNARAETPRPVIIE